MLRVSLPKTEAGIRTIPMLDIVKDAFEMLYEEQEENGFNETEIDGMTGFIFCNRFGGVPNPQTVNHTIKRILNQYNADEVVRAKKESVSYVRLIEPPLAEPHERWCERSEIPQSEEFPPTRFKRGKSLPLRWRSSCFWHKESG